MQAEEGRLQAGSRRLHVLAVGLDVVNDRLTWSDEIYRIFGLQPQEVRATTRLFLEAASDDLLPWMLPIPALREGRQQL